MECENNAGRRPQYDLRFLMLATLLAAMWVAMSSVTTAGSKVLLTIYGLTFLFGCWKTRRAVLWTLPAMYLPYVWLVSDLPSKWDSYRWQWIEMVGQLPGLLAELPMHPMSDLGFAVVTSLATLGVFFAAVLLARTSLLMSVVTAVVLLLVSSLNSWIGYALFRL